jgi:Zinc finger, C2H2 type
MSYTEQANMDFDLESARKQQTELSGEMSNTPALGFNQPNPYNLGVALHGIFIPFTGLTSYTMYSGAPNGQPLSSAFVIREARPDGESLVAASRHPIDIRTQDVAMTADPEFPLNFAPHLNSPLLYTTPEHQDWSYQAAAPGTITNEYEFPSQIGAGAHGLFSPPSLYSTSECQDWRYEAAAHDTLPNRYDFPLQVNSLQVSTGSQTPFLNSFAQDPISNMLDFDIPSERMNFSGTSFNTNANPPLEATDTNLSFNGFSQDASDSTAMNTSFEDLDASTSDSTETETPFNNSSQNTSSSTEADHSWNDLGQDPALNTSTSISHPSPPLSTTSSTPHSPTPPSPGPSSSPPNRTSCPQCPATFARAGDLKRHEKVHFPRQRTFHCRYSGCERKGARGFYRRDKLRDHVRVVHGS